LRYASFNALIIYDYRTYVRIVNGKIVVKNGKLVSVDEDRLFYHSQDVTRKILEVTSKKTGIDYYKK